MAEIATHEPLEVTAGDRVTWKRLLDDYKPEDGWVLSYTFIAKWGKLTLTATDNGDSHHLIDEAPAVTNEWLHSNYKWQAYVTRAADRFKVSHGTLVIHPNYENLDRLNDVFESRKILDALKALLLNKATQDQLAYSVSTPNGGSRSITRLSLTELRETINFYEWKVKQEEIQQRIRDGLGHSNKIVTRFK